MQVVKKKQREDGTIEIEALDTNALDDVFFWAPDGLPDYGTATDADKRYGYYSEDDGFIGSPKEPGKNWW